jgi:hypothetical protein
MVAGELGFAEVASGHRVARVRGNGLRMEAAFFMLARGGVLLGVRAKGGAACAGSQSRAPCLARAAAGGGR